MKLSPANAPALAMLLGLATATAFGVTGWSAGAHAQSAAAPAASVPPAATPAIPPAASSTAAPPEVPAAGTGSGTNPHKGHAQHGGGRGMSGYLNSLHDELAITPAEEPLWNTFAASMRDTARQLSEAYRQRREQLPSMNAVADMNSFISLEQMRLDGLKKSAAAFTALYQTMPPDQQKVADAVFLSDMPGAPHHSKKPKTGE